ncbi:hypothetical protein HYPBUDRAFT_4388 [Hyphopichia burtonii NRRL Y-1933]|uniref:Uncharacterized protein n=1 Tax=Hyphopichia burtonii NRRL Y-1933 TaxID=984485 RepID=A0A1E4RTC9_9ASCO|nr:hypothetical protein HYPBUDRAFT_4388 [Hyphopichia burtonii NRRL Y-1933]ODV70529.1 hypothetical protein HYPBUDRAFT_4388 [Hyphopichia burtonii NRRL Y-1933]
MSQIIIQQQSIPVEEIKVPQRSPARLSHNAISEYISQMNSKLKLYSPDLTDASSFEDRNDGSDKSISESIFSTESVKQEEPADDIEDWEMLLDEIELDDNGDSNLIFQVDEVVSVVAIHNSTMNAKKPLTCVNIVSQMVE